MHGTEAAPGITWLSSRLQYWSARGGREPSGLREPEPLRGVGCLLFEFGAGDAGWLGRLARSIWFAGLEPRAEDLAPNDVPHGSWTAPAEDDGRVAAAARSFFASAALPDAWYAAVAVPPEASPAGLPAALGLVSALRERRDPLGRRLTVVVTVEAVRSLADAFVQLLLDQGAFLVRAGLGAAGDHLHHFPLRAPVTPRRGQLAGVDLADFLHTWRPGRLADLHVIPSGFDQAAQALCQIPTPAGGIRALNLGFHLDLDAPGNPLVEIDQFATHCREFLLGPKGDMVFTSRDRLDGKTGSADLLVVHEPAVAAATATIHPRAFQRSDR